MSETETTPEEIEIEALEKRQADRNAARAKAERSQYAIDLKAREDLEDASPDVGFAAVKVARFIPGQPTRAIVRMPTPAQYKRYLDMVGKGVEKKNMGQQRAAQDMLAQSCWVYPTTPEGRESMLAAFPGIITPIILAATTLAEGKAEEEGKG